MGRNAPTIREIPVADVYALRRAVLRGGDADARVAWDEDEAPGAFHLAAFTEASGVPVAVASFSQQPIAARPAAPAWRLRGMAVDQAHQGEGLGLALLRFAHDRLVRDGADVLWCNARMTAAAFYAKASFIVVSDSFTDDETGLAHQQMLLDLPAPLFTKA
jgi:GNAT superfamily N-acetyltransferase